MKIAVCVKVVPEATVPRMDAETRRLDRAEGVRLNPPDGHAVVAAVALRERAGAGEVVAVCLGPPRAAEAMRLPAALGADRSVHVTDPAAQGSDLLATARLLAAVLERERPELVLFGQQSLDSNGGLLWGAVADRLRLPMVSRAIALEVEEGKAIATCSSERGLEVFELPLPSLVAVSTAISEPRVPTFRDLKRAGSKRLESLSLADLGAVGEEAGERGSRTTVLSLEEPPSRGHAVTIAGGADAAPAILAFLTERGLV